MHLRRWCLLTAIIALAIAAVSVQPEFARDKAWTQETGKESRAPQKLPNIFDGFEFERMVARNTPFSATLVIERHQLMPDGTVSTKGATSLIYRDTDGRTRRDDLEITNTDASAPRVSTINDSVTGFSYTLLHRNQVAYRNMFAGSPPPQGSGQADKDKGDPNEKKAESLGTREIEGVLAEGIRISVSFPAGAVGNEQPFEIVSERWYSPAIQAIVLVKRVDPRVGETVYRLADIKRDEPAAALFAVPRNYKIQDQVLGPVPQKTP
jgi:hypothetical protein